MTTGFVTLRVEGGEIEEAIGIAIDGVSDLSPLFAGIHPRYLANTRRMYRSHGFGQWPTYEEGGDEVYGYVKGQILEKTITADDLLRWDFGPMERIYPSMTDATDPEHVADIEATRAEFGTSVPHAINHEQGTGVGPVWSGQEPIPQRQLTLTDRAFLDDVQEEASIFAAEVAELAGGTRVGLTKSEVVLERVGRPVRGLSVRR